MKSKIFILSIACVLCIFRPLALFAEPSYDILKDIEKFGNLGRVLYIAAHPDDENTKVISALSKNEHLTVAYLSLTRGDGGQNLIGDEQAESLGLIRTEELLQARKIDGGRQFFTRAKDFGFSKTAEETLRIWPRDEVLGDIVLAIRNFRPDIIITRFAPDTEGHGHHKASAILAREAFFKSADRNAYPEQLKDNLIKPWQAKKLFLNKPHWLDQDYSKNKDLIRYDVGSYDGLSGLYNGEIAAMSRSMHRSQGFGSKLEKGAIHEYFEPLEIVEGERLDLLGGLDFSWKDIDSDIEDDIEDLISDFDFRNPGILIEDLINLRKKVAKLKDYSLKQEKLADLDKIILNSIGFSARIETDQHVYNPGGTSTITISAVHSSEVKVRIKELIYDGNKFVVSKDLAPNVKLAFPIEYLINSNHDISIPFWLRKKSSNGAYVVEDQQIINYPERDSLRSGRLILEVDGSEFELQIDAGHYTLDPVKGEKRAYVSVLPMNIPTETEELVRVEKKDISKKENRGEALGLKSFNYDHFPAMKVALPINKLYLNFPKLKNPPKIAYVQGPGDKVPHALRTMGFDVEEFDEKTIFTDDFNLNKFKVLILGVRVLNTVPKIEVLKDEFLNFTKRGGTLIAQYSTVNRISKIDSNIWPYPLTIGNLRVTDENSNPNINFTNPVFSSYFKIDRTDFNDWIQERGLYFASTWDEHWLSPLSFADPNEKDLAGGLLITKYGNGYFVYTGLSFFRQLPAGVSGAAKIFTNLIYLNKHSKK